MHKSDYFFFPVFELLILDADFVFELLPEAVSDSSNRLVGAGLDLNPYLELDLSGTTGAGPEVLFVTLPLDDWGTFTWELVTTGGGVSTGISTLFGIGADTIVLFSGYLMIRGSGRGTDGSERRVLGVLVVGGGMFWGLGGLAGTFGVSNGFCGLGGLTGLLGDTGGDILPTELSRVGVSSSADINVLSDMQDVSRVFGNVDVELCALLLLGPSLLLGCDVFGYSCPAPLPGQL